MFIQSIIYCDYDFNVNELNTRDIFLSIELIHIVGGQWGFFEINSYTSTFWMHVTNNAQTKKNLQMFFYKTETLGNKLGQKDYKWF